MLTIGRMKWSAGDVDKITIGWTFEDGDTIDVFDGVDVEVSGGSIVIDGEHAAPATVDGVTTLWITGTGGTATVTLTAHSTAGRTKGLTVLVTFN